MKTIEVPCEFCGVTFTKLLKEYNRSEKIGRKHYCSRTCASSTKEKLALLAKVNPKDASHLNSQNRLDEFTLFRPHLRRAKARKHFCDLTLEQMKEVWNKQQGICVYSKVKLQIADYKKENNPIYTISLDRIDSNIGYTKDNIQFISVAMNHLKNKMSHEEMLTIINILRNGI